MVKVYPFTPTHCDVIVNKGDDNAHAHNVIVLYYGAIDDLYQKNALSEVLGWLFNIMFMVLSIQPGQESQKTMLDSQLLSFD